jgi:hypothetical protein
MVHALGETMPIKHTLKSKEYMDNRFEMRASGDDKENIQKLAALLGCTESQAVREAVKIALASETGDFSIGIDRTK